MESKGFLRTFKAALVCLPILLMARVSEGMDMQEGEWEISTEMVMEGMPFSMPPTKMRQCLTQKDLVPREENEKDKNCTIQDQQINGNTVAWTVVCKDSDGTSEGTGEITYAGKSYKGDMEMTVSDSGGEATHMSMKMSGQYLGPCAK